MDKLKKKNTATTQISYYWSLALFARHFEAEINADLADVVQSLRDMKPIGRRQVHQRNRPSHRIDMQAQDDRLYTFKIKVMRYSENGSWPAVKASGRIIYSEGYERTIVRGDIRLAAHFFLVIFAILFAIVSGITDSSFGLIVMALGACVWMAYRFWEDYRNLREGLQNTLDDIPRRETDPAQAGDVLILDPTQNENSPIEIDA